jgi:hypothetical protein
MDGQTGFLKRIIERLEAAGMAYMLTGSMAMTFYAAPRMTRDVHLVIECRPGDGAAIAALFEPDCYVDAESAEEAIAQRSVFNVIDNQRILKADFVLRALAPEEGAHNAANGSD